MSRKFEQSKNESGKFKLNFELNERLLLLSDFNGSVFSFVFKIICRELISE